MITIDTDDHGERFPEEFGLFSNVGEGEPAEGSTFPANDKHLLADSDGADNIFALFGVIELVHVVNRVDVRFILDKPTNFPAELSITNLAGRFEHGQS